MTPQPTPPLPTHTAMSPAGTLTTRVRSVPFGARGHVDVYQQYHFAPAPLATNPTTTNPATDPDFPPVRVRPTAPLDCGHDSALAGWHPTDAEAGGVTIEIGLGLLGLLRLSPAEACALRDALTQILADEEG